MLQVAQGQHWCALCELAAPPVRPNHLIDGKRCQNIYIDGFGMSSGDSQCTAILNRARTECCDESLSITDTPTASPVYQGPVGNNPPCPVCRTLEYPGLPKNGVDARYIGKHSCAVLYDMGLNGLIEGRVCEAYQDFSMIECGCGIHNPACKADSSNCYQGDPVVATGPPTDTPTAAPYLPPFKDPPLEKFRVSLASLEGFGGAGGQYKGNRRNLEAADQPRKRSLRSRNRPRGSSSRQAQTNTPIETEVVFKSYRPHGNEAS